jgi:hypothetical protein
MEHLHIRSSAELIEYAWKSSLAGGNQMRTAAV